MSILLGILGLLVLSLTSIDLLWTTFVEGVGPMSLRVSLLVGRLLRYSVISRKTRRLMTWGGLLVVMTSLTAALGLLPAALAESIGSQAQKPLAIVVVGGMLVTLFLTRYLMPVLYSFFPAPLGHGQRQADLFEGSHFTDEFLRGSQGDADQAQEGF